VYIHICYYVIYIFSTSYPAHLNYISRIYFVYSGVMYIYIYSNCFSIHLNIRIVKFIKKFEFSFRISNSIYKARHKSRILIFFK